MLCSLADVSGGPSAPGLCEVVNKFHCAHDVPNLVAHYRQELPLYKDSIAYAENPRYGE